MRTSRSSILDEFRATVDAHLDAVDHWVFASQSAADYFLRVYEPDPDRIEIIEHGSIVDLDRPRPELDRARIFDNVEPGTWGPPEADALIKGADPWHAPTGTA